MSDYISAALRRLVAQQASNACEYCLLPEAFSIYRHEVDHVIALKHGGQTVAENLVLACLPCNRYKGSDLTSFDPESGALTPLFNPCNQSWADHFGLAGGTILGLTPVGRTTVFLLRLNESSRLQLRQALAQQGLYPNPLQTDSLLNE